MKITHALFGIVIVGCIVCMSRPGLARTAAELYQEGLMKENAEGDLEGAIEVYQKIVKKHRDQPDIASKAQLHIGICYEKQGKEKAKEAYQEVIKGFPRETEAVQEARDRLQKLTEADKALGEPLEYYEVLTPVNMTSRHSIDPQDGSVVYTIEGTEIRARMMSDRELSDWWFPKEELVTVQAGVLSNLGSHELNPYTYGNWKDPEKGYTPRRFTVFNIQVLNYESPNVELNPAKAVLETDQGAQYTSYLCVESEDFAQIHGMESGYVVLKEPLADNYFEKYYKPKEGSGPLEAFLYEERMKLVRSSLFRRGEPIFKGDLYAGFLVFDPLPEGVRHINLSIKDFVLRFDTDGEPLDTADIIFEFDIEQGVRKQEREGSSRGTYFFRVDPGWKKRHPEYDGHYGVIHYQDYNGDGRCQSHEIIEIIPEDYPYPIGIDLSKPSYSPMEWERVLRKRGEQGGGD